MNRLFGILIISLSLLTSAVIFQNAFTNGGGPPLITIVFVLIVFMIGVWLILSGGRKEIQEEQYISNEEIEKQLEDEFNK
ncbi:lipopolysaccharide export LptBFGC system permease protein LptF [Bacillus mesophilus]|uniref:Uncharacterized protein n=1 Tax=Bacillus mesophilus TaxID=1808955 RepID=A0A6M0Q4R6_9BACI|nr:hypothetical protein [Bacillus mesophilus]MBM7661101.1 lipopolysaccharide export LptBFGC system permease protein LptF [Bacillus mesophilus]NEY71367.1 hypothetical protein [Bacillus mesophilus]